MCPIKLKIPPIILELLERVFLRIGVAESDDQLEKCLYQFLAPTILKAASQHKSVQNKVLELLTHISKRLKSRPAVQLPMDALLGQFANPESPPQIVVSTQCLNNTLFLWLIILHCIFSEFLISVHQAGFSPSLWS